MQILFLAVALAWLQHKACPTYQSKWCGLGALHSLKNKQPPAPMAYRVLGYPFRVNIYAYHAFKAACIYAALFAVREALGDTALWITAFILPFTFWYDYWDWAIEMAGFYFALSGNFYAAMVFAALWGMSRETAPLVGIVYLLAGYDVLGAAALSLCAVLVMLAVRLVQGKRQLYCDRFMLVVNNKLIASKSERAYISVIVILLCVAGIVLHGALYGLVPLALIFAGVAMGKLDETRLFSTAVPMAVFLWKAL